MSRRAPLHATRHERAARAVAAPRLGAPARSCTPLSSRGAAGRATCEIVIDQPSVPALAEPEIIDGRYRIEQLLGVGGMASVFVATHIGLSRKVAIKILDSRWRDHADVAERFRNEARTACSIAHASIVDVFDVGEMPDGRPYYVMELLEGRTLGRLLREFGRVPAHLALQLAERIGEALAAAHDAGVIHRDLKPDNILVLDREGKLQIKILDFGIAHADEAPGRRATAPGTVMGTPEYMAPEQSLGNPAAPSVDIYALGVILFEMLTGQVPLAAGEGEPASTVLIKKVTGRSPALSSAAPDLPGRLCDLVDECLARKPMHRPGSVAEVLHELAEIRAALAEAPALRRVG